MKYPINNYVVEDDVHAQIKPFFELLKTPIDTTKKKIKPPDKLMTEYCFKDDDE